MHKKILFLLGIAILVLILISYFIPLTIDQGSNFLVKDSLLGVIIFHNPFILGLYILASLALIIKNWKRK